MKMVICGDIVPTRLSAPYFETGDIDILFGDVLPLLASADRVVANLECALTNSTEAIKKCGPNLKASPICAKTLKKAGITDCSLSNNHVLDFGEEGLNDTLKALSEEGIHFTGVGKDETDSRKCQIIEEKGVRIALISVAEHEYTYALPDKAGVWPFDPFDTMEDITEAKKQSDFTIVLYHGGKEQCEYPSPRLLKACHAMIRAGADMVFCQHSHCIGCIEDYRGGKILYGQGNFHFIGNRDHPHWKGGLIVQINFNPDAVTDSKPVHGNGPGDEIKQGFIKKIDFEVIPVVVKDPGIILANGDCKKQIMDGIAERSRSLYDGTWLAGWLEFCKANAKSYTNAVAKSFAGHEPDSPGEAFPHYLDCEAHTDVLRELYQTYHKKRV